MTAASHEISRIPRVRFAISVQEDESLPGIVTRAAREHVLPDVGTVLRGAEIAVYNPGVVISIEPDRLPLLAHVLRQDERTLSKRMAKKDGKALSFGSLTFPVGTIDTRLRRIGPHSLRESPHHRFAWMNRLLPYCPETGEILVSKCPACHEPLRWYRTWGIDTCETCRRTIPPSPLQPIEGEELDRYRLMASIMSFDQKRRTKALDELPERIRGFAPGILALTSIQLAGILAGRDGLGADLRGLRGQEAYSPAGIVSHAGALLRNWPNDLRNELQRKVEQLGDDHGQFFKTWRALKRFSSEKLTGSEKAALVLDGIPDLQDNIWNSFRSSRRTYSTGETMRVLGIDNGRTIKLAACVSATQIRKPSLERGNRQYIADVIDDLRETKNASITFSSITEGTGIPNYGVEQLAASEQIEFRSGEAMLIAYPRRYVSSGSFLALKSSIEEARSRSKPPACARPLDECARLLGGGEKPWHLMVAALGDESLPHWGQRSRFDIGSILVRPVDIRQFLGRRFEASAYDFPFSPTFAKREAAEILTIDTPQLDASLVELELVFQKAGRAMKIERDKIIEVAKTIITNAELAEHWGIAPKSVRFDNRVAGIRRVAYGWTRSDVIDASLIPGQC